MADRNEVKSFKWRSLKDKAPPNSVLYVLEGTQDEIGAYVTDKFGKPIPLSKINPKDLALIIDESHTNIVVYKYGKITSKKIKSDTLNVDYIKDLDAIWIELKHKYLKPGDNISELNNDSGYATESEVNSIIKEVVKEINNEIDKIPTHTSQLINDGENGLGKYLTSVDYQIKEYPFNNSKSVVIRHNLGRYVDVDVIIGLEKVIADIEYVQGHNTVVVKFSKEETGVIIIR